MNLTLEEYRATLEPEPPRYHVDPGVVERAAEAWVRGHRHIRDLTRGNGEFEGVTVDEILRDHLGPYTARTARLYRAYEQAVVAKARESEQPTKRTYVRDAERAQIRELVAGGMTYREVALKTRRSLGTVHRIVEGSATT